MQKWLVLGVIVVVCVLTTVIVFNLEIESEYVPELEVSSEELRKTLVSVYLKNKTSNELVKENILVDSKTLLKNPYGEFVSMLIKGSENENLVSVFPEGTTMPEVKFDKGVVSVEFKKENGVNVESLDIENIKKALHETLKVLTEVDSVKLIVDGKEL